VLVVEHVDDSADSSDFADFDSGKLSLGIALSPENCV
jgi:hypothetical protein